MLGASLTEKTYLSNRSTARRVIKLGVPSVDPYGNLVRVAITQPRVGQQAYPG